MIKRMLKTTVFRVLPVVALAAVWAAVQGETAPNARLPHNGRPAAPKGFAAHINTLLQDPGLKGGIQGVVIQSVQSGKIWYERNADTLLVPASNNKLLTSSAILTALGPDWRYHTLLRRTGGLDASGTLNGDLALVGSGDPLLNAADLDAMVQQVVAAGIHRVSGSVYGDDSRFDAARYGEGWAWDDMQFYYSAQVSALNLNENMARVVVTAGRRAGERVRVRVDPAPGYIKVINRAQTGAKGAAFTLHIAKRLGVNEITVDGVLPLEIEPKKNPPVAITVDDPALFASTVLTEKLLNAGIDVDGGAKVGRPSADTVATLADHASEPLGTLLAKLNKPSDNLVAECFLKTLGAEKGGAGTVEAGRTVAYNWFKTLGMDLDGIDLTDGSGLSRETFVTARNLAILLRAMAVHPYSKPFLDSLPIAGVDGTMSYRLKGTAAQANCHAKTGYVSSCSSISGYVSTRDGELLVFSMIMNNHKAPNSVPVSVQDKIVQYMAEAR